MSYITEYVKEEGLIQSDKGVLRYCKVTPKFEEGEHPECVIVKGGSFLYDDYSGQLKPGDVFYEIMFLEVKEQYRRSGEGTRLVNEFFKQCKPKTVVLRAGITDGGLYEALTADRSNSGVEEYIYANVVPFWESVGFTDVNHTTFYMEESVPMLWPKSAAEEAVRRGEAFKARQSHL